MCPLILEMRKYPNTIEPIVAVTAQHREMLDQVMTFLTSSRIMTLTS